MDKKKIIGYMAEDSYKSTNITVKRKKREVEDGCNHSQCKHTQQGLHTEKKAFLKEIFFFNTQLEKPLKKGVNNTSF